VKTIAHMTLDLSTIIGDTRPEHPREPWPMARVKAALQMVDPQAALLPPIVLKEQAVTKRAQGREVWSALGCTNVKPDGRCGGHAVYQTQ
jgi:hypothetical protein